MKKYFLMAAGAILIVMTVVVLSQNVDLFQDSMTGYEEVPTVSTNASGEFIARIAEDESEIFYDLSYSDLEGAITQAHIHFGQKDVNGAIMVWLCGNPPLTFPAGTQPCPAPPARIIGVIRPNNVVGQPAGPPAGQGIQPGEFSELLRALRAGKTYANVHSTKFPGGEVRSQIDHRGHRNDNDIVPVFGTTP